MSLHTSVTSFIAALPPEQQVLTEFVHEFICQEIPEVESSIKWAIPFYTKDTPLCFLNPKKTELVIGFYRGAFLPNASGALTGTGKQVRHLLLPWEEEVSLEVLRALLQEAVFYAENSTKA